MDLFLKPHISKWCSVTVEFIYNDLQHTVKEILDIDMLTKTGDVIDWFLLNHPLQRGTKPLFTIEEYETEE